MAYHLTYANKPKGDIDWEIKQLWMAIDYYERAREATFSRKEANQFEETIKKLNQQVKALEKDRDERY